MIEENYNVNVEEPKKKHTGAIVILCLLVGILLGGGVVFYYFAFMNNNKTDSSTIVNKDTKEEVIITSEYEDQMVKMAKLLYDDSTNHLNLKKLDNQTKLNIAVSLSGKNYDKVSGNELIKTIKKYFGSDATLKLEDILCTSHSGITVGSKVIYKYNKEGDNFVYNTEHAGHGGSHLGVSTPYIFKNKIITDGKKYKLVVGIYFTGDDCISDICVPTVKNGYIYNSSSDAKNGANMIFDASKDDKLYSVVDGGIYTYDHDAIYEQVKNKLDTYTFEFEVKDADLIFKKYDINN